MVVWLADDSCPHPASPAILRRSTLSWQSSEGCVLVGPVIRQSLVTWSRFCSHLDVEGVFGDEREAADWPGKLFPLCQLGGERV